MVIIILLKYIMHFSSHESVKSNYSLRREFCITKVANTLKASITYPQSHPCYMCIGKVSNACIHNYACTLNHVFQFWEGTSHLNINYVLTLKFEWFRPFMKTEYIFLILYNHAE